MKSFMPDPHQKVGEFQLTSVEVLKMDKKTVLNSIERFIDQNGGNIDGWVFGMTTPVDSDNAFIRMDGKNNLEILQSMVALWSKMEMNKR